MTNGLSQLGVWRNQAAKLLEDLIPQIRSTTFTAEDQRVDDLLRTLSNQPPRPIDRAPYVGFFGNAPILDLRKRAAAGVKIYLDKLNDNTLVAADDQADRLIRQLRGFSTNRPTGVYPYEGLFGYSAANISQTQIKRWRQQAAAQLQRLIADISDPEPTAADELADMLLRGLGGQPPRPANRLPYEGLFTLPRSLPFPQLRQRAADALKVFIEHINNTRLGSKDAVIDDVIRKVTTLRGLQNLGDRPVNRLPYQGLFGGEGSIIQLSRDFTLQDLTRSVTASLQGIDNTPPPSAIANLKTLVQQILQPAQDALGPLAISSGYRSSALNQAVGGVPNSDHTTGYAADVIPTDGDTRRFAEWVVRNVPFDQVILEYGTLQRPDWIHVSASPLNRRQVLRQDEFGTRPISI
ncbi:MAG: hypothetical protein Kow00121_18620 [Elainellaceae cyanobacterium]